MAWGTFDENENVTPSAEEWQTVYFAGQAAPGIARVSVVLSSDIDERKEVEVKKSFVIDKGAKPVRVTIELDLLPNQLAAYYRDIVPLIAPRAKSASQVPVSVSHPLLLIYSLEMLITERVDHGPMKPGGGITTVTISMVEYEPAPKGLKKSKPKTEPTGDTPIPAPKVEGDVDRNIIGR